MKKFTGPLLELLVPVRLCDRPREAGERGRLCPYEGWSMYDLHQEVPFDGCGVPHEAVAAVVREPDGREQLMPLGEWARVRHRRLLCRRCGLDVLNPSGPPARWSTPERVERCRREREHRGALGAAPRARRSPPGSRSGEAKPEG